MNRTPVAFLWHMHQPDYGLPGQGLNLLPWVRLHATKAYLDLPWLLRQHPEVKGVINLSGSLLQQLSAYADGTLRDVWWDLSVADPADLDRPGKFFLLRNFFSIHWDRHVRAMPGFAQLLAKRGPVADEATVDRWSDRELLDLQVLFNLAWMGFAAREDSDVVKELLARGSGFSADDKAALLAQQMTILRGLIPMYRDMAQSGQIELTTTPLYHPILPLLVDSDSARRCAPSRPVPRRFAWPQDAAWHVEAAASLFEDLFGARPRGMWPAEGSVSPEVVPLFAQAGVRWIASDEEVLMASSPRPSDRSAALYRPYTTEFAGSEIDIIFRDHTISDLIGFTYAHNPAHEAADDLVTRLEDAASRAPHGLISVILDGENPWEAYPDDGRPFLTALFERLGSSRSVRTALPGDELAATRPVDRLEHLHSGSWILGNYQIWIGAPETNQAWNLLGQTRGFLAGADPATSDLEAAFAAMHAAQGSDWFWWYGDDFVCGHKAEFDDLFRAQLRAVYTACGADAPSALHRPIGGEPATDSTILPPRALINPRLDGDAASFFCWAGAGAYEPSAGAGSMFRSHRYIQAIHFGYDRKTLFIRVDPDIDLARDDVEGIEARFCIQTYPATGGALPHVVSVPLSCPEAAELVCPMMGTKTRLTGVAFGRVLELAVPFELLGAGPAQRVDFFVSLVRAGLEFVRHPPATHITVRVPDESFERDHWVV